MGIGTLESMAADKLRPHIEEHLKTNISEACCSRTDVDTRRLLDELQVHQIELEMQNAELRQARDEMSSLLEKYADLYDFAPVGYFTLDSNGDIKTTNIAGACLIGGVRSRLASRPFSQYLAVTGRPAFADFLGRVLMCKIKESCEMTLLNGSIVQIEAMSTASGQEFRIAVIDITGRRVAEDAHNGKQQELETLNSSLEARILQAVNELRQKDQMLILQDRLALMGEMINNIAHQWRQPLNTLGLTIQQLPLFYGSPEFSRKFLEENTEKSLDLIQHMSQTINDFRDFFRSDKEISVFCVNKVIRHTLSLIEQNFKDQNIRIIFSTEGEPVIYGYPNEYAQVLLNIMMNARDALVERHVEDARISLHSFAEGGKTFVTISDNAGGIDTKIIDRIFDPYFTTREVNKGTGIGLFMSKTIIEKNMDGWLTASNIAGGAEFRIEV